MADILFPQLSAENPEAEGVVATWFVDEGATVIQDQLVAEVAVDKVDVEVLAPQAGTVHLLVEEGGSARQGAVIATVE